MIGYRLISSLWGLAVISVQLAHVYFDGQCKNCGGGPECLLWNLWSLLDLSRMRTPTPKSYHHWHPLAFRRASSHHYCACKVFCKFKSRWPGLPGGGASGVRGLMRDNWFSAAPCRDAGQQNSWNLENVKNKLCRSGFIWRSTSMWNEKASFPLFFLLCFECSKRALPGKSHGLKCQIASGNVGRSWRSCGAATQNTRKALSTEKRANIESMLKRR